MTNGNEMLKTGPYSAEEAGAVCERYGMLKGTVINGVNGKEEIEYIEVAPYNKVDKWMFFHSFMEQKLRDYALGTHGNGEFDIVVITKRTTKYGRPFYTCKDLKEALDSVARSRRQAIAI